MASFGAGMAIALAVTKFVGPLPSGDEIEFREVLVIDANEQRPRHFVRAVTS